MFGERYFATRERLSEVVTGIISLAKETGVNSTGRLSQELLDEGLATPFLFVVCGEVNAGKSTLLNALFGENICKVNVLPETDRVIWYKYGDVRRDNSVSELLLESYAPIEFLKDFNLVDTPGTNSVEKTHQSIAEQFMPSADLLLFVFPVSNPWGAATWDFLGRQSAATLGKVVFLLQQCDQRDPADIPVILDHLADLAMKRIGRVPPIFPVSGKMAYESKKSMPFSMPQRRASGIIEIEDFISKSVCNSPTRRSMLQRLRHAAAELMKEIEDKVEDQIRTIERDARFLEDMEREIDKIRALTVSKQLKSMGGIDEVFQREAHDVSVILKSRMSLGKSLVRVIKGEDTAVRMESLFQEQLRSSVELAASRDYTELIRYCCQHWESLRIKVRQETGIEIETVEEIENRLADSQAKFVQQMGRASSQSIGNLRIRSVLDLALRQRNASLNSLLAIALLLLIAAGICGALLVPWVPWILVALSCVSVFFLFMMNAQSGREVVSEYRERLFNSGETFSAALRNDYEEGIRVFFREYAHGLLMVRRHLVAQKSALQPRLQRWNDLFLGLKAIEQEIS